MLFPIPFIAQTYKQSRLNGKLNRRGGEKKTGIKKKGGGRQRADGLMLVNRFQSSMEAAGTSLKWL